MRWKELTEAPISDYGSYGDLNTPGSFGSNDLKAIKNDKWVRKLHTQFEKTPFNFNIYLYNAPDGIIKVGGKYHDTEKEYARYHGLVSFDDVRYLTNKLIPANVQEQGITVVLTQNEGSERIPMTPWMTGHRIAHAIAYADRSPTIKDADIDKYLYDIRKLIENFYNRSSQFYPLKKHLEYNADGTRTTQREHMNLLAKMIGTFRSAREGNVRDLGEFVTELMTQYLVQGKVTLNKPDLGDGRAGPEEPDPVLDKAREYWLTGSSKNYPTATGFAEWMTGLSKARKPTNSVWAVDPNGDVMASIAADGLDDPRVAAAHQRFLDSGGDPNARKYVFKPANKAAITKYEKKAAAYPKFKAAFEHYRISSLLQGPHKTDTDDFDERIDEFETGFNQTMRALLARCVGKAFIL